MKNLLKKLVRHIRRFTQERKERRHSLVGPAHLWKIKRDFQIQFLKGMNLKPNHYLLEIGCGTLRGGIPIIDYLQDGNYFGIEVRNKALDEGRKELKESGLEGKNPTLLLSSDISELALDRKFDFIWSFSVLIHLQNKILNDTLNFVSNHLSEEGVCYANVNIGEGKDGSWQGFPVVKRTLNFYIQACSMHGLIVSDIGSLKELGHVAKFNNQRMLRITRKCSKSM